MMTASTYGLPNAPELFQGRYVYRFGDGGDYHAADSAKIVASRLRAVIVNDNWDNVDAGLDLEFNLEFRSGGLVLDVPGGHGFVGSNYVSLFRGAGRRGFEPACDLTDEDKREILAVFNR